MISLYKSDASSGRPFCDEFHLFATMVTICKHPHSIYNNRENYKSSIILGNVGEKEAYLPVCLCNSLFIPSVCLCIFWLRDGGGH